MGKLMNARSILCCWFGTALLLAGCAQSSRTRQTAANPRPPQPVQQAQLDPAKPSLVISDAPKAKPKTPAPIQLASLQDNITLPATAEPVSTEIADEPAVSPFRRLADQANAKWATMNDYVLRMRRREVVGGSKRPEELMLCKFRKEPFSVYFKWIGSEGQGREVVYVKDRYDNQIHTLTATGDVLFLPGGKRFKVSPDSILVKAKSRHPITEAGLGNIVYRYTKFIDAFEKGQGQLGSAKYLGLLKRTEFEDQVEGVLQTIPPRSDPLLPKGGQRLWFFDPVNHWPVLLVTQDDTGEEVEYYCHDRIVTPARLDEADFNPDILWKN